MVVPAVGMAVAALLWPFNIYLPIARQLPRVCAAISQACAYMAFHLGRILADDDEQASERWERAVRFIFEELLSWRPHPLHVPVMGSDIQALLAFSY